MRPQMFEGSEITFYINASLIAQPRSNILTYSEIKSPHVQDCGYPSRHIYYCSLAIDGFRLYVCRGLQTDKISVPCMCSAENPIGE